jgi:HD-like signal output (HDOD) protein
MGDEDVELRDLADIINQDPPIAARVLGLANSAFFGQAEPIVSVEKAIIQVLGLNMVKSLALSMALAGSFDSHACRSFRIRDYWLKALATGGLAAAAGRRIHVGGALSPDSLYLGGLLHNLGVLLLVHLRPAEMAQVFDAEPFDDGEAAMALEYRLLGVDRWRAGEWLAFRWHLPDVLGHTLGHVRDEGYNGPYAAVVEVVRAARRWVDGMMLTGAGEFRATGVPPEAAEAATAELSQRWEQLNAFADQLA